MPSPLQPEQAMFLRDGHLLPLLKSEYAVTRRVIEAIPSDKSDFRHDEVAKCAIDLAWHIVGAEHRFIGLNHSIHYRGQLSIYLRPMGAKVASIYRESYDSAQVRQAKA
jgi:uncharacterized damage-inducible protein DinB